MSTAREEILARIRHAHITAPPAQTGIPRDYQRTGTFAPGSAEVLDLLEQRLLDYRAAVHRIPAAGLSALLAALTNGWKTLKAPGVPHEHFETDDDRKPAAELDHVDAVVTAVAAAAAETGTLALDGSPNQGRRALTLVPDRHVCIVRAEEVVHSVPEMLARLDPRRPLTLISGPSATSDIELQRVEGVHGPRTLIVILVQ